MYFLSVLDVYVMFFPAQKKKSICVDNKKILVILFVSTTF
jgi:hypothetical protein